MLGDVWCGYVILNGCPYKVAYGDLAGLKAYAWRNGYDGIFFDKPSMPFGSVVTAVSV